MRFVVRLVLGAAVLAACTPTPTPSPTQQPSIAPSSASLSPLITPTPSAPAPSSAAESVACVPFTGQLPAGLEGDPCPSALAAVRAIVEPLKFPIARIYIEPGPFICGSYLWPGIGSPPVCFGPIILPGTKMHGWIAFQSTGKVAAVALSRRVPGRASPSSVPPWRAVLMVFVVPPAGWVMP
jgi:hypothetical protein